MSLSDLVATMWPRILIWDVGRYVVVTLALTAITAWVATSRWRGRRIQMRRASRADYVREIVTSLRTCLVFTAVGVGILLAQAVGFLPKPPPLPGHGLGLLYLAGMLVGQDAYFYWTHRALHHPKLFTWTHRLHHQSITPTPFTAYAFSVPEAIVQALFVVLWVAIVPTPQAMVMLFMVAMLTRNSWGHAGYELHPAGMLDHPLFGKLTTTLHHDLHHSGGFTVNYGLWFTWWDRWMGTEHPAYRARYRALTASSAAAAAPIAASPAE